MFKNTTILSCFILRRDRFRLLIWFGLILLLAVGFGAGIKEMYPDQESLDAMVEPLESPAFKAMLGVAYLEDGVLTLGGMYSVYLMVWQLMFVGCMSVALVVRHTRSDEERGRLEVIRSLPVGRLSNLAATLWTAVLLNVVLGLLTAAGLYAVSDPERGMDLTGALIFGATCAAFGMIMAGAAAIFCQLNKNPGTAMALSFSFIGLLYVIFMAGSMQGSDIALKISVLGLLQQSAAYVNNNWTPVIITFLIAAILMVVALQLCKSRDLGESLIPSRPGKADAAGYLKSPSGLARRLLKNWVIFWVCIIPVLGIAYGSVMGDMETFVTSNDIFMQMSQGNVMVMASVFMLVMMLIAAIPVLQFVLKARNQEKRGYSENILSRSTTPASQLKGYFIIALVTALSMPFLNAFGFWAGSTPVMEEPMSYVNWLASCLVYLPAMLVFLGFAVLLFGWFPKLTGLSWGYIGYSFVALYFGTVMNLPEWLKKLSPFGYVPQLPRVEKLGEAPYILPDGSTLLDAEGLEVVMPIFADEATYSLSSGDIAAMIVMTALSAAMCVIGFIGYNKRDLVN